MGRSIDFGADGRVARLYSVGETLERIADTEGVTKQAVLARLKRMGLWSAGLKRRKGRLVVQDLGDGVGLVNANSARVLGELPGADLIVTSPPYDDMREYGGFVSEFDFNLMADAIVRNLKDGGVLVWVVMDQLVDGGETLSSFRQALGFQERGLKSWHTLIWEKWSLSGARPGGYYRIHEYMFVFCKGDRPKGGEMLIDRKQIGGGRPVSKVLAFGRIKDKVATRIGLSDELVPEFGKRGSIWRITAGGETYRGPGEAKWGGDHPAAFPYKLARDHILSWSNAGDLVIDPMAGSGTVLRAARDLGRRAIGIEVNTEYCKIIRERMGR